MIYGMDTGIDRRDWVGRVIDGRFPLLEWLGDSEGGSVFLTELPGAGSRRAAIKLMGADTCDAESRLYLWSRTSALSHPHLIRLFYAGRCATHTGELLYVVTEFAEENLAQILPKRPLSTAETAEMLPPVLDALTYLHDRGFVHTSLKPSNLLVVEDQLKLSCDRLQRIDTRTGKIPAPRIYDAPECSIGTITPAADLWALGVTLVEALSQHPPVWERSGETEPAVPEALPRPYGGIARGCLRADPRRRCTLQQFKSRLKGNWTSSLTMATVRWPLLAVAVVVLITMILVLHLRSPQPNSLPSVIDQQPSPAMAASPTPAPAPTPTPVPETPSTPSGTMNGSVVEQVLPDVSPKASSTIRGKVGVSVRVTTDKNGEVTNAELDSPSGSKYFSKLALQAARRWRFKAAQVDGRAVSSEWIVRFQFAQTETKVTSVEAVP